MIDEKILQDEILSDEELENISGGTLEEYRADKKILQEMGLYSRITNFVDENVKFALNVLGGQLNVRFSIKNYTSKISDDGTGLVVGENSATAKNSYYIEDKLYSREDFWNRVNEIIILDRFKIKGL
ncbi:MAG: bacteriocin [Selenomonadaceae bacterium]|nr:bacteriocin [Selenomonadaceae bacterium]